MLPKPQPPLPNLFMILDNDSRTSISHLHPHFPLWIKRVNFNYPAWVNIFLMVTYPSKCGEGEISTNGKKNLISRRRKCRAKLREVFWKIWWNLLMEMQFFGYFGEICQWKWIILVIVERVLNENSIKSFSFNFDHFSTFSKYWKVFLHTPPISVWVPLVQMSYEESH